MSTPRLQRRGGFSLLEMLAVIAIVAVVAAFILPVFQSARRKAQDAACTSQLRQIGQALMQYAEDHDGLYPARSRDFFDAHCFSLAWSKPSHEVQEMPLLSAPLQPYVQSAALFHDPLEQSFTDDDNGGACSASSELVSSQPLTFVQRTELSLPEPKLFSALPHPSTTDVLHTFSPWRNSWMLVLHADGHVKGLDRSALVKISQAPLMSP